MITGIIVSSSNILRDCVGNKKGISKACLGINNTYKGYYWSYLPDFEIPPDKRKKKVIQYDLEGNIITIYNSVSEASRILEVSKSSIAKVCRDERKQTGGYKWKYHQKQDNGIPEL